MQFSPVSSWIWMVGEDSPRNFWLRVRRTFSCAPNLQRATLLITADSRYELFVNAAQIGEGPVRSFPWSYSYDRYDITSWLRAGEENTLAARVVHWGDHTFQYIRGRGGFLCELLLEFTDGQSKRIGSDGNWLVSPDPAVERDTPRISVQQAFEEQYDARAAEQGWTEPQRSDSGLLAAWQSAHVVGPVGIEPWTTLVPRTVPFLTHDPVLPLQVLAVEQARPKPGYRWCFDLRQRYASPEIGLRGESQGQRGRAFATEIIAPETCTLSVYRTSSYDWQQLSYNGEITTENPATITLRAGRNLFIVSGTEWPSLLFATEAVLSFDASRLVPDTSSPVWAFLAPFDERHGMEKQILQAPTLTDLPDLPRTAILEHESMLDVALLTSTQDFLLPAAGYCDMRIERAQPRIPVAETVDVLVEQPANLLHEHALPATIFPQANADVHLVLDFGRELIGYLEFTLDAPEGTILDAHLFEGIDESGIFWPENLRNSLRYTCREGYQTYRSAQRRGFRYLSLTLRAHTRSIKLYQVRCLLSTYPVEWRGSFVCSDAQLTKIWEVAAYTVQLCMEDTYTDCPAYEQTFWVGDARNSALVNAVAFGAFDLTEHCLRLTAQSLSRNLDPLKAPELRAQAHLTTDHVASGWLSQIPMWSFLWIWNVWEHYLLTGDKKVLAELYPAVRECLQRCVSFLSERGLLDIPNVWNLVDWAAMDLTSSGEVTANNALFVVCLRRAATMTNVLAEEQGVGEEQKTRLTSEAAGYLERADLVRDALNTYCWSEERGAYVDTVRDETAYARMVERTRQQGEETESYEKFQARTRFSEPTNTLVLQCQCASPERVERILPLVEAAYKGNFVGSDPGRAPKWPAEQTVPVGSPWFLFFTLETLLAYRKDVQSVIALIREQWGRMLEKGATTFWETFPGFSSKHWSRSLCHGWSAAPAYFLSTQILGVHPAAPGYAHIRVAPYTCGLQWAEGTVPTPRGDVFVRWSQDAKKGWTVELSLPVHASATLTFEDGIRPLQYVSGTEGTIQQADGRWFVDLPVGGHAIYQVSSAS